MIIDDQLQLLEQLCEFFETVTLLLSEECTGLSTVPLIQRKIKKLCSPQEKDLPEISSLKNNISQKIEQRIAIEGLVLEASLFDPCVVGLVSGDEAPAKLKSVFEKWI